MAGESMGVQTPLVDSLAKAETWLNSNSDLLIQYGVNIISAVLILFIGNIVAKMVANSVAKMLDKKKMDKAVVEFIHGIVRYTLFVIVLIAALSRIGVQTASVVAVIGAAGLAIGLALQGRSFFGSFARTQSRTRPGRKARFHRIHDALNAHAIISPNHAERRAGKTPRASSRCKYGRRRQGEL